VRVAPFHDVYFATGQPRSPFGRPVCPSARRGDLGDAAAWPRRSLATLPVALGAWAWSLLRGPRQLPTVLQARTQAFVDTCARHVAMGGDAAPGLKGAADARVLLQSKVFMNVRVGTKSSGVPVHLDQVTKAWPKTTGRMAGNIICVAHSQPIFSRKHFAAHRASAAAFSTMPDAPLPQSAALLLCMAPDGYLTDAAAFLESAAGASAAAAAQSLANDARHEHEPPATPATRRRRRGARRRSAAPAVPTPASSECPDEGVPACPPAAGNWLALDTVDLAEELRCPVPTLQDVPPFMRAAVRAALTTALQQFRDSAVRMPDLDEVEVVPPRASHVSGSHAPPRSTRARRTPMLQTSSRV